MRTALAMTFVMACAGCGGPPLLAGAPKPNTAVVAGTAAAVAGIATLADPGAAGKKPEAPSVGNERRTVSTERMPGDVLDRLDKAEERGDVRPIEERTAEPFAPDAGAFPVPKNAASPPATPR